MPLQALVEFPALVLRICHKQDSAYTVILKKSIIIISFSSIMHQTTIKANHNLFPFCLCAYYKLVPGMVEYYVILF